MSVAECQARVSSEEFTYWQALFTIEADEAKAAQKPA
jgi:hypothetical protein